MYQEINKEINKENIKEEYLLNLMFDIKFDITNKLKNIKYIYELEHEFYGNIGYVIFFKSIILKFNIEIY